MLPAFIARTYTRARDTNDALEKIKRKIGTQDYLNVKHWFDYRESKDPCCLRHKRLYPRLSGMNKDVGLSRGRAKIVVIGLSALDKCV